MTLSHQELHTIIFILLFLSLSLEKLLSKRSRASPTEDDSTSTGPPDSTYLTPAAADSGTVAELHKKIEELSSQNSELTLKVQVSTKKITHTHTHEVTGLVNEGRLIVK